MNALNPKTALFFLALLPQFVAQNAGPAWLQILAFGAAFVAFGFVTNSIYGKLGGKLGSLARRSGRFRKATRYVGGGTLVALGVAAVWLREIRTGFTSRDDTLGRVSVIRDVETEGDFL